MSAVYGFSTLQKTEQNARVAPSQQTGIQKKRLKSRTRNKKMQAFQTLAMMGQTEILVIVFVIFLLFGAKKVPELARALGKSLGEFKKGQREGTAPDPQEKAEKENETKKNDSEAGTP
jgi:TatA/E family protein of Tat protein translocase